MVDMDKLSCLAQLRRSMMSNPLYKARLEQSRYESYKKRWMHTTLKNLDLLMNKLTKSFVQ